MNDSGIRRLGGVAGIVFAVLVILPFLIAGESPDFADDAETIGRYFLDNEGKLFAASVFAMLSAFALAWFVSGLRDASGDGTDGGRGRAGSPIAIGGAIAASAFAISGAILAVGAARVDEHGEAGAAASFVTWDLFMVTYGAAAPIGLAALLSGVAVVAIRGGTMFPAWLGWVSLVLAVVGLVPPISFALIPAIAIWSLVVGILMLRRPAPAAG